MKTPATCDEILAAYRRGLPARVGSDPELRTFVVARIERMRFTALVAGIAAAFPDDCRVQLSALNRWWLLMGNAVAANPAIAPNIK